MSNFVPFNRDQSFLLPPDLKEWLPQDDIAHFIVEAVERVALTAFAVPVRPGGKPQYHPRLMLALLIYCYANGIFSSRRIERATHRDLGVRFVAANLHPDHDTIAAFRQTNKAAFQTAFLQVLLLARESGLLTLGTVSIDGTKMDANASKIRSLRYERAQELRRKLEADIAGLTAKAEAADAKDDDPQALPKEMARREKLKAKLDAACARMEAEAKARADAQQDEYAAKQAAYEARGKRGRAPKPPDETPLAERQSNLTDPDSQLMRKSAAHEYRQAYNAQAVVDADGSQLILANSVIPTPTDQPSFASIILGMEKTVGLPCTVLADAGFASGEAVAKLKARDIEPLVAIARTQPHRPYDFRPPPEPKAGPAVTAPWRIEMKAKLESEDGRSQYRKRKQTVEPVFGIIKNVLGFTRFRLRGLQNVVNEWMIVSLAYNCRRLHRLRLA